jgi:hypothetical protein
MLLSDIRFSLLLFLLFLIILLYWLFSKGLPLLMAWLKGLASAAFPKKLRAAFIILFLAMIIAVNVLPFNFRPYEEEELKYDYSFYLQANSEMRYGSGYGTNLGGLFLIYPLIYKLFGISSLAGTLLLKKVLIVLTLPLYFLLIRKILGFFIPASKWQYPLSTLLTLLYLSMPQINLFFWNQRFYYFSAHLLFILAFFFLLEYLKSKSTAEFLLYLLSLAISVQTRPEFAAFAVLLLTFHLLSAFDFSRFQLKSQSTQEKALILTNLAVVAFLAVSATVFMHDYQAIRLAGSIQQVFGPGLKLEYQHLLGLFNPAIIVLFSLFCLAMLIHSPNNRKYIILFLSFICALFAYIIPTTRLEPEMYTLYVYILLFCILAYALSWPGIGKAVSFRHIASSLLIILIVLSNLYLITSKQNLLITGDVSIYNRNLKLQTSLNTLATYEQMRGSNLLIFEKFAGKIYFSYVFKDTNSTILGLSELKGLNTTYKNDTRRKLIFIKRWSQFCTQDQVIRYIDEYYKTPESPEIPLESDYLTIIRNIRDSEIRFYSDFGPDVLCEIISPQE